MGCGSDVSLGMCFRCYCPLNESANDGQAASGGPVRNENVLVGSASASESVKGHGQATETNDEKGPVSEDSNANEVGSGNESRRVHVQAGVNVSVNVNDQDPDCMTESAR